jgi:hypothetical protein
MKKLYVVVDVGCIECGEYSTVLYVGIDKAKATKIRDKYEEKQAKDWHGQHYFKIYIVTEEKTNSAKELDL